MRTTLSGKPLAIDIPEQPLAEWCRKWGVREVRVFGSVRRDDFDGQSDVDVIADFDVMAMADPFDIFDMEDELAVIFGRDVHLLTRGALNYPRNERSARHILGTSEVVYAQT